MDWKGNGRDNQGRFDFLVSDLAYGTGPPLHIHATQEDSFFILEGVLTVQLGDDVVELVRATSGQPRPAFHTHSRTHTQINVCAGPSTS